MRYSLSLARAVALANLRALTVRYREESSLVFGRALEWYAREAAEITGAWGAEYGPERVLGAAAALSPGTSWALLKRKLGPFLSEAREHPERLPHFATYGRNRALAARIVRGEIEPGPAVFGPKVGPFYVALRGDPAAVVIDRHTCRQAIGKQIPSVLERRAIVDAFHVLAHREGLRPAGLQAALWTCEVGWNGRHAREAGGA